MHFRDRVISDLEVILQSNDNLTYELFCHEIDNEFINVRIAEMLISLHSNELTTVESQGEIFRNVLKLASLIFPLISKVEILKEFAACEGVKNLELYILQNCKSEETHIMEPMITQFLTLCFDQSPSKEISSDFVGFFRFDQPLFRVLEFLKNYASNSTTSCFAKSIFQSILTFAIKSQQFCAVLQSHSVIVEVINLLPSVSKDSLPLVYQLLRVFLRCSFIKSQKQPPEIKEIVSVLQNQSASSSCKLVFGLISGAVAKYFGYQSRFLDAGALDLTISCTIRICNDGNCSEIKEDPDFSPCSPSVGVDQSDLYATDDEDYIDLSSSIEGITAAAFSALFGLVQYNFSSHVKINHPELHKAIFGSLARGIAVSEIISIISNCFRFLKSGDSDKRESARPLCDQYLFMLFNLLMEKSVPYCSKENIVLLLAESCLEYEYIKNCMYNNQGLNVIINLFQLEQYSNDLSLFEMNKFINYSWGVMFLLRNLLHNSPRMIKEWKEASLSEKLLDTFQIYCSKLGGEKTGNMICAWGICLSLDEFPESLKKIDFSRCEEEYIDFPISSNALLLNPEALILSFTLLPRCSNKMRKSCLAFITKVLKRDILNRIEISASGLFSHLLNEYVLLLKNESIVFRSCEAELVDLLKISSQLINQAKEIYMLFDLIGQIPETNRVKVLTTIKEMLNSSGLTEINSPFLLFDSRIPGCKALTIPFPPDYSWFTVKGFSLSFWVYFERIDYQTPEKIFTVLDSKGVSVFEIVYWENSFRARFKRNDGFDEVAFARSECTLSSWEHVTFLQHRNWLFQPQLRLFINGEPKDSQTVTLPLPISPSFCFFGEIKSTINSRIRSWRLISVLLIDTPITDFQCFRLFSLGYHHVLRRRKTRIFDVLNGSGYIHQAQSISKSFSNDLSYTDFASLYGTQSSSSSSESISFDEDTIVFFYHASNSFIEAHSQDCHLNRFVSFKSSIAFVKNPFFEQVEFMQVSCKLLCNEFAKLKNGLEAVIHHGSRLIKLHELSSNVYNGCALNSLFYHLKNSENTQEMNSLVSIIGMAIGKSPINLFRMDFFQNFYLLSFTLKKKINLINLDTLDILIKMTGLINSGKEGAICNLHAFEAFVLDLAAFNDLEAPLRVYLLDTIVNSITVNQEQGKNLSLFKSLRRRMAKWCTTIIFHNDSSNDEVLMEKRISSGLQIMEILLQHGDIQKQGLRLILDFILGTVESFQLDNLEHKGLLETFLSVQKSPSTQTSVSDINISWEVSQSFKNKISLMKLLLRLMINSSGSDSQSIYRYFEADSRSNLWKWILELVDDTFFILLTNFRCAH